MLLPPSPALSRCDSLDGIEDLDAFLASQGNLSQWPTPPPMKKDEAIIETTEISDDEAYSSYSSPDCTLDGASCSYACSPSSVAYVATILAEEASIDIHSTPRDVDTIRHMVIRAELPLEVIALALNILSGLHDRTLELGTFTDSPPDLLVVGAFSLAVSYTNDHPPRPFWWSHYVCDCEWTGKRIDQTVLKLLGALDFSLHKFSSEEPMERAIARLSKSTEPQSVVFEAEPEPEEVPQPEQSSLKLLIDSNATRWEFGQLTPESTPPCSASPAGLRMPLMRFLPLL